jgi:hypothetical protein
MSTHSFPQSHIRYLIASIFGGPGGSRDARRCRVGPPRRWRTKIPANFGGFENDNTCTGVYQGTQLDSLSAGDIIRVRACEKCVPARPYLLELHL